MSVGLLVSAATILEVNEWHAGVCFERNSVLDTARKALAVGEGAMTFASSLVRATSRFPFSGLGFISDFGPLSSELGLNRAYSGAKEGHN